MKALVLHEYGGPEMLKWEDFVTPVAGSNEVQKQQPGASFKSNKLLAHHGQFLSEWTMFSKDGSALATAHSYGRINEQGLITAIIGFF